MLIKYIRKQYKWQKCIKPKKLVNIRDVIKYVKNVCPHRTFILL